MVCLPNTGFVVMRSSQRRFFTCLLRVLAEKTSYFVISGPDVLKNVDIWSDLVTFH